MTDRSFHSNIGKSRRREAAANESFYGVIYSSASDVSGEIGDTDNESEAPRPRGTGAK